MIQELTLGEGERPDSSSQCLKFMFELFILLVFAGGKDISGLVIVFQVL